MKRCFAYIRVSTARQEEQSASFTEQHSAISRYAQREGLEIIEWFQEVETAAKRGRTLFAKVVKLLRAGKAEGLIIHKIDRSSRNYFDWGEINELADRGVSIHFAHDNLVLTSRSSRLMADIQAVFATDYIRNLKDEIHKGINGRLTEGLLPWGAPLGYVNNGGGRKKTICPIKGPLVRQAFELYATGRFTLRTLARELSRRGLKNYRGGRLTYGGLAKLLANPFYVGIILYKKRGEAHQGAHEALIPQSLFDRVQRRLDGKAQQAVKKHAFTYRRMFRCRQCGLALIAEQHKGHVYYRCHSSTCSGSCVREEQIDEAIREAFVALAVCPNRQEAFDVVVTELLEQHSQRTEEVRSAWKRELAALEIREERLVDALLDGTLDKETFESRKGRLLLERKNLEDRLADTPSSSEQAQRVSTILELASTALLSHQESTDEEKREHLEMLTSNRQVDRKKVVVELAYPYSALAQLSELQSGGREHIRCRTGRKLPQRQDSQSALRHVIQELYDWLQQNRDFTIPVEPRYY